MWTCHLEPHFGEHTHKSGLTLFENLALLQSPDVTENASTMDRPQHIALEQEQELERWPLLWLTSTLWFFPGLMIIKWYFYYWLSGFLRINVSAKYNSPLSNCIKCMISFWGNIHSWTHQMHKFIVRDMDLTFLKFQISSMESAGYMN